MLGNAPDLNNKKLQHGTKSLCNKRVVATPQAFTQFLLLTSAKYTRAVSQTAYPELICFSGEVGIAKFALGSRDPPFLTFRQPNQDLQPSALFPLRSRQIHDRLVGTLAFPSPPAFITNRFVLVFITQANC